MDRKLAILEYQEDFADNFSTYAYGKILEQKYSYDCVYGNVTDKREDFENIMSNFKLNYSYVSKSRVDNISEKSQYLDTRDLRSNKINRDRIIDKSVYSINDVCYISDDIKKCFEFKNIDFIVDFDILEEINSQNSIGLYINQKDKADVDYIERAYSRLNKYLKQPILYIFTQNDLKLSENINYKIISNIDWREEFYFLKKCKNKILHCTKNSYSEGFWAAILGNSQFSYVIFNKCLKTSKAPQRWIKI